MDGSSESDYGFIVICFITTLLCLAILLLPALLLVSSRKSRQEDEIPEESQEELRKKETIDKYIQEELELLQKQSEGVSVDINSLDASALV